MKQEKSGKPDLSGPTRQTLSKLVIEDAARRPRLRDRIKFFFRRRKRRSSPNR